MKTENSDVKLPAEVQTSQARTYSEEPLKRDDEEWDGLIAGIGEGIRLRKSAESGHRAPQVSPIAIFIIGKPCAGKTTLLNSLKLPPITQIDTALIEEKLPGYMPNLAPAYHARATDIRNDYVVPEAIRRRLDITIETVGNPEKLTDAARVLKSEGYKISVIHIHVDSATSAERVYARFQKGGIYLPIREALAYGDRPEDAYCRVKSSGYVDEWVSYENSTGEYEIIESGTNVDGSDRAN